MNKKILVFPCGSEIAMEIHNSLKYMKGIELFGLTSVDDHSAYVFKNVEKINAHVDDEDFISEISKKVKELDIDFIYPAHDSVVLKLGEVESSVLDAQVITSAKETVRLARSKAKTYNKLKKYDFTPKMYTDLKNIDDSDFPIFLKPDVGQGSNGIDIASNQEELIKKITENKDLIAVEMLPGKEYTVDCFTNRHGQLIFTGARERKRIKSGISVNSQTIKTTKEIALIAETLNKEVEFRGQWFFQVKEDTNGKLKLLEIAPRVSGTMNVYRNKGVNLPQLSVFDFMEIDVEPLVNDFDVEVDRALINRHKLNVEYTNAYIDFDDTVIFDDKVNLKMMAFIYQLVNAGKKVILITRHDKDIYHSLKNFKINADLFNEIIHLQQGEKKSSYIKNENSIFIDDSFAERKDVLETLKIPVFDVDAIESLIDWRR